MRIISHGSGIRGFFPTRSNTYYLTKNNTKKNEKVQKILLRFVEKVKLGKKLFLISLKESFWAIREGKKSFFKNPGIMRNPKDNPKQSIILAMGD